MAQEIDEWLEEPREASELKQKDATSKNITIYNAQALLSKKSL
jgi:hypothetical protein